MPVGSYITGEQLARSLAFYTYGGPHYYPTALYDGADSPKRSGVTVYVDQGINQNGTYRLINPYFKYCTPMNDTTGGGDTHCSFNPYGGFQSLYLDVSMSYQDGQVFLGKYLSAQVGGDLGGQQADTLTTVQADPIETIRTKQYPKNATVHQWTAADANQPWFAQLQVHADAVQPNSPTRWKLCWHVRLPGVLRVTCKKFEEVAYPGTPGTFITWVDGSVIDDSAYGKQTFGTP